MADRLHGLARGGKHEQLARGSQHVHILAPVEVGRHGAGDDVEVIRLWLVATGRYEIVRTHRKRVGLLAGRMAEDRDLAAHRAGELDADVPETAEADDADAHRRVQIRRAKSTVHRSAATQEWRDGRRVEARGHLERPVARNAHAVGKSTVIAQASGLIVEAKAFVSEHALTAVTTSVARPTHADDVIDGEIRHMLSPCGDLAHHLVSGTSGYDETPQSLSTRCTSLWQMPQWVMAISTSWSPSGAGS